MRAFCLKFSLKEICRLFGRSPQAWYHLKDHQDEGAMKEAIILEKVRIIRNEQPKIGVIKLRIMLQQELEKEHLKIGRDCFFRLLRENGLLIKSKRRHFVTTNSHHHFKIWSDLVNRRPAIMAEEIWVSDITYIRCKSSFAYLSLVTDAYSRKIVGYNLSRNLKAEGCIKAFTMAYKVKLYPKRPLIHHSDRGIQYCCDAYVKLLQHHQISISMTQSGSPYDNAIAERVNGILKNEYGLNQIQLSFTQAEQAVQRAIYLYNFQRPHFSCELKTPQHRHAEVKNKQKQNNQFQENNS
jgi:putative transposase